MTANLDIIIPERDLRKPVKLKHPALQLRLMQFAFGTLGRVFPRLFANIALKFFATPRKRARHKVSDKILEQANISDILIGGNMLKVYDWGESEKTIMLVHGWESRGTGLRSFVPSLLNAGYRVVAFDAPAHGYSSKGETSISDFTESVGLMIEKSNAKKLISHSFGGVATTYALFKNQHLHIDKYALLTTPDKFTERIDDVIQQVGIANNVKEILISKLKEIVGTDLDMLSVSEFVKNINVAKALIIHDKNDTLIPIERSLNVHHNWNESEFITIEGTGHFRILRTESVINQVVDFLN